MALADHDDETGGSEYTELRDLAEKANLPFKPGWVRKAARHYDENGLARLSFTLGGGVDGGCAAVLTAAGLATVEEWRDRENAVDRTARGVGAPVEVLHNGERYRSRALARWAVFLSTAGIQFEQDWEVFNFDGVRFVPDFWLPEVGFWLHVSEGEPHPMIVKQCNKLASITGRQVLLAAGAPEPRDQLTVFWPDGAVGLFGDQSDDRCYFADDRRNEGEFWLTSENRGGRSIGPIDGPRHDREPLVHTATKTGYAAARTARFREITPVPVDRTPGVGDPGERTVALDRESVDYRRLIETLDTLAEAIRGNNEYAAREPADRERRLAEIQSGKELMKAPEARPAAVRQVLGKVLHSTMEKFRDATIGEIAKTAVGFFVKLFGNLF